MTKPHLPSARAARRALLGAAVAALAVPAAALAAPDRTFAVSSAAAEAAWDGPAATGDYDPTGSYSPLDCSKDPATYCDQTLVKIDSGGPVTIDAAVGGYSNPLADFDLYIYKSDSSGALSGDDPEAENAGWPDGGDSGWPNGFEETATIENAAPGYYLVVVTYYQTLGEASYHGTFKVTGATPVAGGDAGGTTTPPPASGGGGSTPPPSSSGSPAPAQSGPTELPLKAATLLGSAKKAKKTRSLVFKVTAGDTITNLTIYLLSGKKVIGSAKVTSLAKGTTKLKLKVSKQVKAGSYTLASRGTVDGRALQTGQKVKVKK